jgi:hypothetical protein
MSYAVMLAKIASLGEAPTEEDGELVYSLKCNVTDCFMLTPKDVSELYNAICAMYQDAMVNELIQDVET